jgi:hypothetical protein
MDAETNDRFRKSIPCVFPPNMVQISLGVSALDPCDTAEIIQKVKKFEDFNPDNDPWGEHDFGSFEHNGEKIFWKIDDYAGEFGLNLILTVMLAEEY